jgi:hypothetical protein
MPSIISIVKASLLVLPALASASGTLGVALGIHKVNVRRSSAANLPALTYLLGPNLQNHRGLHRGPQDYQEGDWINRSPDLHHLAMQSDCIPSSRS